MMPERIILSIKFGVSLAPWDQTKYIVTSIIRYYYLESGVINRENLKNTVIECYEQTCKLLNVRPYTFRKAARRWGASIKYNKHIDKFSVVFDQKKDAKRFINSWLMGIKLMDSLASDPNEKDLYSITNFLTRV